MAKAEQDFYAHMLGALKREHSVLGIWYYSDKPDPSVDRRQSFTLSERKLFLAMTCATIWLTVWLKYFYLVHWFKELSSQELNDLENEVAQLKLFPEDRISDLVDSMLLAIASNLIQVVVGKPVVKAILKNDYEQKGGYLGFLDYFVFIYAAAFSALGALHFIVWVWFNFLKVQLLSIVSVKLLSALLLGIGVFETASTAFFQGLLPWMRAAKQEKASKKA